MSHKIVIHDIVATLEDNIQSFLLFCLNDSSSNPQTLKVLSFVYWSQICLCLWLLWEAAGVRRLPLGCWVKCLAAEFRSAVSVRYVGFICASIVVSASVSVCLCVSNVWFVRLYSHERPEAWHQPECVFEANVGAEAGLQRSRRGRMQLCRAVCYRFLTFITCYFAVKLLSGLEVSDIGAGLEASASLRPPLDYRVAYFQLLFCRPYKVKCI